MAREAFSADRMADAFVNYLYDEYQGARHVRRVASWLGLLILGVEKVKDRWWIPRTRQLFFEAKGRRYKAKYNHGLGSRGGIEIIEVGEGRGSPEIRPVATITSLEEAERFYANPNVHGGAEQHHRRAQRKMRDTSAADARKNQPAAPANVVLAEVRRLGLKTPSEAAALIRADRDGR